MPIPSFTTVEAFPGYFVKRDPTQLLPGALIVGSKNVGINDGDRVAVRQGVALSGASSTATTPITSSYTFKKRDGSEIPLRAYGTVLEYQYGTTWYNLYSGLTSGKVFGFADYNINTDYTDRVCMCNAVDPWMEWSGNIAVLDGALAGGETTVTVDSTLQDFVFYSGTASAVTTTTLTIGSAEWASNLWTGTSGNRFFVLITSGSEAGKISDITATTSTQITFTAISGLSGTPTFEIRRAKFSLTGSIRIGTTDVSYTGLTSTTFTGCSSVPATADETPVTQIVTRSFSNPRGNIIIVDKVRLFVAGVQKSPSSVYYSKIGQSTDFSFSATRIAGEGGVIDTPEGGGAITGLGVQENLIYVLKNDVIKSFYFTQDGTDLHVIETVAQAPNVGANYFKGVFKIDNQLYYTSKEGAIKTVSRVESIDTAQALQLSDPISGLVGVLDFTAPVGVFFKQKAYIACRTSDSSYNNVVLVFNFQKQAWEAPITGWAVASWHIVGNELYFGHAINAEVYKVSDRYDDNGFAYEAIARFSFNHFGQPALPKEYSLLFMEGYITENTEMTIRVRYNYNGTQEVRETILSGTDTEYIVASASYYGLGMEALGLSPLASEVEVPEEINKFRVYLVTDGQPFYELSVEVSSNQEGARWEILRFGYNVNVKNAEVQSLHKSLS